MLRLVMLLWGRLQRPPPPLPKRMCNQWQVALMQAKRLLPGHSRLCKPLLQQPLGQALLNPRRKHLCPHLMIQGREQALQSAPQALMQRPQLKLEAAPTSLGGGQLTRIDCSLVQMHQWPMQQLLQRWLCLTPCRSPPPSSCTLKQTC